MVHFHNGYYCRLRRHSYFYSHWIHIEHFLYGVGNSHHVLHFGNSHEDPRSQSQRRGGSLRAQKDRNQY